MEADYERILQYNNEKLRTLETNDDRQDKYMQQNQD